MKDNLKKVSKYLSYLLRHKPDSINLNLDENGWVLISELIEKSEEHKLTRDLLKLVVETNDKQRFMISQDGKHIRANQGHSINIELDLEPIRPPEYLYHGTAERFLCNIQTQGLQKGQRHHVHLTESEIVAKSVGTRYGKPVILKIKCEQMWRDKIQFFRTANNVWLVDKVQPHYITVL